MPEANLNFLLIVTIDDPAPDRSPGNQDRLFVMPFRMQQMKNKAQRDRIQKNCNTFAEKDDAGNDKYGDEERVHKKNGEIIIRGLLFYFEIPVPCSGSWILSRQ